MERIFLITLVIVGVTNSQSTCKINSPTSVCFNPKPVVPDFNWYQEAQPADGWHMELGNSAVRLHIAELMQGKLLNYTDDFSNMCGRSRLEHFQEIIDGKFYGFNGGKSTFKCYPSKIGDSTIYCDYSSIGLSKYDDHSLWYPTYADNKNLIIGVFCFPNGENGWVSFSKSKSLTQRETKLILDHIKSLGYDTTDVVSMYNESLCTDNSVDASYLAGERVRPDRPNSVDDSYLGGERVRPNRPNSVDNSYLAVQRVRPNRPRFRPLRRRYNHN